MRQIVLATRNPHKVGELQEILDDLIGELDLEIVGVGEFPDVADVVETGVTFAENAVLKAQFVAQATGPVEVSIVHGRTPPVTVCANVVECTNHSTVTARQTCKAA